jgi:hypothetical protein
MTQNLVLDGLLKISIRQAIPTAQSLQQRMGIPLDFNLSKIR